jgi:hypothetical protein
MKETVGIEKTSTLFFSQESNEINAPVQPCGKPCTTADNFLIVPHRDQAHHRHRLAQDAPVL